VCGETAEEARSKQASIILSSLCRFFVVYIMDGPTIIRYVRNDCVLLAADFFFFVVLSSSALKCIVYFAESKVV